MKKNRILILIQLFLLATMILTASWLFDTWMVSGPHGQYRWVGMDFASYWVGVKDMLQGTDPYRLRTTLEIQNLVYGGPAMGEDPMLFSYPAWLFLIFVPFSLLPYQLASVIWVGVLLWAVLNLLKSLAAFAGGNNFWKESLWFLGLVIGSLPFIIISVMKGQLGCLSLLALFGAYQLRKQNPLLAGMILSITLIKPTVTVVPAAIFLGWALFRKNWRLLAGFAGLITVLLASSFIPAGNWIPDYFEMLETKVSTIILWSMEILSRPWNYLYAALFIGILVLSIYLSLKKNRPGWFSAAVLAGVALTPMRWIYDLFLAVLILSEARNLSPLRSLLAGIAVLSPWLLVLVPVSFRWDAAMIGIPLIWAATVLPILLSEDPPREENRIVKRAAGE